MVIKVLILAFVVLSCSTGSLSLKCNLCIGSQSSDCAKNVSSSMGEQYCLKFKESVLTTTLTTNEVNSDKGAIDLDRDVYCVSLSLKDNSATSDVYERGCGYIYKDQDICQYIKEHMDYVDKCSACKTDLCN